MPDVEGYIIEDDILIISCGDDEVSISSSKWMRGLGLQYSIHSNMNDISYCEGDTCWVTLHLLDDADTFSHILTSVMTWVIVHIQTIPWDAERKHISKRSHDRCWWYIISWLRSWAYSHVHMFTYIPQMLSVHAHLVSKRNIYYVVSISYDHYDAEHIMHIMWSR